MSEITQNRRVNEALLLEKRTYSAQSALIKLIENALFSKGKELRGEIMRLCNRNGFAVNEISSALELLERADWVRNLAEGIEVYIYLTEHAKMNLRGG